MYKTLQEQLLEAVRNALGKNFKVETNLVQKVNISLEGIVIREVGDTGEALSNVCPTIYFDSYIKRIERGSTVEAEAQAIVNLYFQSKINSNKDFSWFMDFNQVKDRLACKLVNYELNKDGLLTDVPFRRVIDYSLAIVFYVVVDESDDFGMASILVHNNHLAFWDITVQELEEVAFRNTPELLGVSIRSICDVLNDMIPDCCLPMMDEDDLMYVLSSEKNISGSVFMLYHDILEKFSDNHGGKDIIILPSSTEEVILIPCSDNFKFEQMNLSEMIAQVNETEVDASQVLGSHPFFYKRKENKIIALD